MNEGVARLSVTEMLAEVGDERVYPDALDGLGISMQPIELAAPLSVAEVQPVGGLVAGADEAGLLDKGLQQHRTIGVASMPVIGQTTADEAQNTRGEIAAADPRQYEEARVVDDEVKAAFSLLARPADELVARLGLPGACPEGQQGHHLAGGAHEVAQLRAGNELMPQIVVTLNVSVPQQRLTLVADRIDREPSQIHRWDARGLEHRLLDLRASEVRRGLGVPRRRQADQAIGLHPQQRHPAAHVLQAPIGAAPAEPFADRARELRTIGWRGGADQGTDQLDLAISKGASAVAHPSARIGETQGLLVCAQHQHVLVQ